VEHLPILCITFLLHFDVIFKDDLLRIVRENNSITLLIKRTGNFVEEIKEGPGFFRFSCVVHISRKVNSAAHILAREATTHVIDL
jgi:hypothetical protein